MNGWSYVDSTAEFSVLVESSSAAAASFVVGVRHAVAAPDSHFLLLLDLGNSSGRVRGCILKNRVIWIDLKYNERCNLKKLAPWFSLQYSPACQMSWVRIQDNSGAQIELNFGEAKAHRWYSPGLNRTWSVKESTPSLLNFNFNFDFREITK